MLAATLAHLDVGVLTFIIATAIPILTAILTKSTANSSVKSVVTLTLALIATAIQRIVTANGVVNLRTAGSTFVVTWIIAIATYYGLLKPTGVTPGTAKATAKFGIG